MSNGFEREIARLDRRIDALIKRIDNYLNGNGTPKPVTEPEPTPLRYVGAVATLLAALGAFITPIVVVLVQ